MSEQIQPHFLDRGFTDRQAREWLRIRVIGLLVFAVIVPITLGWEEGRWCALLLVALAPAPNVLYRIFGEKNLTESQVGFDIVASLMVAMLAPALWMATLIAGTQAPAASTSVLSRRTYLLMTHTSLACFAGIAIYHDIDQWWFPIICAVGFANLIASYTTVHLSRERSAESEIGVLSNLTDVVLCEFDPDTGHIIEVRSRSREVLGYTTGSVPLKITDVVHPEDLRTLMRSSDITNADWVRCRVRHADGSWRYLRIALREVPGLRSSTIKAFALDITDLVDSAENDQLTRLPNRRVLTRKINEVAGTGTNALMVIDLDRFKEVNDTLGHGAGDEYLTAVAGRLAELASDKITVARLGGDEFAVFAQDVSAKEALELAQAAGELVHSAVDVEGLNIRGTASIGIARSPEHGTDSTALLRAGDIAMYEAKKNGSAIEPYTPALGGANVDRLRLTGDIDRAVEQGELRLWFQPKFDLRDGRVVGAEGLLRWHHPTRGVLQPGDFLDVVELSRHFAPLTLDLVDQAADLLQRLPEPLTVSVNMSIHHLADPSFCRNVLTTLARRNVTPERLVVEVTEREIYKRPGGLHPQANILLAAGVTLSIDDFGTGHSSLVRLHDMPVSEIKIDRRFVSEMTGDADADVIVRSVINLGLQLGHTVVAEGIENNDQRTTLAQLGCVQGQGFLWSPAVEADAFVDTFAAVAQSA